MQYVAPRAFIAIPNNQAQIRHNQTLNSEAIFTKFSVYVLNYAVTADYAGIAEWAQLDLQSI